MRLEARTLPERHKISLTGSHERKSQFHRHMRYKMNHFVLTFEIIACRPAGMAQQSLSTTAFALIPPIVLTTAELQRTTNKQKLKSKKCSRDIILGKRHNPIAATGRLSQPRHLSRAKGVKSWSYRSFSGLLASFGEGQTRREPTSCIFEVAGNAPWKCGL
jgi:hypothetical protein